MGSLRPAPLSVHPCNRRTCNTAGDRVTIKTSSLGDAGVDVVSESSTVIPVVSPEQTFFMLICFPICVPSCVRTVVGASLDAYGSFERVSTNVKTRRLRVSRFRNQLMAARMDDGS